MAADERCSPYCVHSAGLILTASTVAAGEQRIKILAKVFLTLLIGTGSAIAVMAVLMQINLGRGFLEYINELDRERLDDLSARLAQRYQQSGSWDFVRDGRVWRQLIGAPPPRRPPRQLARRDGAPDERRRARRRTARAQILDFGPRVTLYDVDHRRIKGRPDRAGGREVYRLAVKHQSEIVGWLTLRKARQVSASRDIDFLRQQSQSLIGIGLGLLAVAALLAFLLARHLTRPLTMTADAVKRLAQGDYDQRINPGGSDEASALARDVDTLGVKLAENRQARQRWIADISHELRTPLAIVRGELEALKDGVRKADPAAIDSLHAETMRMSKLVDDLHELSLSDIGALSYQMRTEDLVEIIDHVAELFRPRIADRGMVLDWHRDLSKTLVVSVDRSRIEQLLTNLLENSLRYTNQGGRVRMTVTKRNDQAVIEIADTEPGVSPQECGRLFDRLYRVESSRNRDRGGSGLGLSISQNITLAHGGTIVAQPSSLGGLSVVVRLPWHQN